MLYIMESEWLFFAPNVEHIYKINVYDDGNERYAQYGNEWLVNGKLMGKRSLINYQNQLIVVPSISKWKISRVQSPHF